MCRSRVAIPGSPRLRRQIGLQGGDKCQHKPIKISQPLSWLSDLVPPLPAQPSCSGDCPSRVETPDPEWRRLVRGRDPIISVEIQGLEERLLVWSRDPNPEQRSQRRDPKTPPRLCSNDWQNRTSSRRPGSRSPKGRTSTSPKRRSNTSTSC